MNMDVEERSGVKVIRLHGELVGDADDTFLNQMTDLLDDAHPRVVLDLTEVSFISSAGLGDLVRLTAQVNTREGRLALSNLAPFIEGVLETTRLDKFFEVFATADDAAEAIKA
jgi:anti-anti-sigma factor